MRMFRIPKAIAFQKYKLILCNMALSKVICNCIRLGEKYPRGFKNFKNTKLLITFDKTKSQERNLHFWKATTPGVQKLCTKFL